MNPALLLGEAAEQPGLVLGKRQRLGDQLYGQILEQIVSGRLSEGTRLPAEQDICKMFGVSRPVVRQALSRLRADGLVQARQGSGTYVMARPADRLLSFAEPRQIADFLRCIEIRLVLEGSAARFAAERRSEKEMADIIVAHERFRLEAEAGALRTESDLTFHTAIATASGNHFFPEMLENLHEYLSGFMNLTLRLTHTSPHERASVVLQEHSLIVEAIRNQDPESAQIAMQFHITQARRRMIDRKRD
ncbi:MAG: GntR family transcriptional regulator [Acidocella sp. 20-63-7]|nr:MAG: GntR family transcriptional regulator [Acidocella sp. 20-63-7]HQT46103.1 FadR/GntR family transcriptional regulator [Acidocella sp.]